MRHYLDEQDIAMLEKCAMYGFHPSVRLFMSHDHHTDMPIEKEDMDKADALAYFLGSNLVDVEDTGKLSSVDEWSRIFRALRLTGLKIVVDR